MYVACDLMDAWRLDKPTKPVMVNGTYKYFCIHYEVNLCSPGMERPTK